MSSNQTSTATLNVHLGSVPPALREWVAECVTIADGMLRDGDALCPTGFIVKMPGLNVQALSMDWGTDESKAHSVRVFRERAREAAADAVFVITEAWALSHGGYEEAQALIEQYGSISESPARVDCVLFSLETAAAAWSAFAQIYPVPLSNGYRCLREVYFETCEAEGLLAKILSGDKQTVN